jgi:hypothetical protein
MNKKVCESDTVYSYLDGARTLVITSTVFGWTF